MTMRNPLSRFTPGTRFVVAGAALILATNAVILAGAAYNRSGTPEALLTLSQRELTLPYNWAFERENSGLSLNLSWRTLDEDDDAYGPAWLNRDKLRALGFSIPDHAAAEDAVGAERFTEKAVLVVLELDGPARQQALAHARQALATQEALLVANPGKEEFKRRADRAREELQEEEGEASRLFAIDAGLDRAALRAKYPDRRRYVILHGRVRPYWFTPVKGAARIAGRISGLGVDSIHVPLEYKTALASSKSMPGVGGSAAVSSYAVQVAFGQRLEPWVTGVSAPAAVKPARHAP